MAPSWLESSRRPSKLEDSPIDPDTWQRLGDYRLIREIGRGGMGVVYEAEQLSLGRRVALKLLPTSQLHAPNVAARFQREAAAAASLNHTNIVPVFESGRFENNTFYYAMQLIAGKGLNEVREEIKRSRSKASVSTVATTANNETRPQRSTSDGSISTHNSGENLLLDKPLLKPSPLWSTDSNQSHYRFVSDVGRQAASALQHAHERGIVHRDVKPANLIIDAQGGVWLTDFGIAKWQDKGLTKTTEAPGTLRYMSPERFGGLADARSDIYSLGATMYELLTLTHAFTANDDLLLLEQIKNSQPRTPRSIDPCIPIDLQTIVLKAMAKEPQHRYSTAAALKEDLERFLAGREILGRHVGGSERLWLWAKRNTGLATMIAIVVIGSFSAGLIGMSLAFKFSNMADEQTALAQKAQKAEKEARRSLYFLETNLVSMNLESNTSVIRIRDFLGRWTPTANEEDFRGWEWHFLNAFSRRERRVIDLKSPDNSRSPPISFGIDYTPDGTALAVSLTDQVLILDSKSGKEILRLPKNQGIIIALRFSHSGNLLAVTSEDKSLRIWDWKQRRLVRTVEYGNGLGSVSWHPNDQEVTFFSNGYGDEEDAIQVLDLVTGSIRKIFLDGIGHHTRETGYSPDGKYFATSLGQQHERYAIVIFDTENWEVIDRKDLHSAYILSIARHPGGQNIASASIDGTAKLWELDSGDSSVLFQSSDGIASVDWSGDGDYLAIAGWDSGVRIWDFHGKRLCDSLQGHETKLRAVSWHPHRPEVASVDWYGQLRIFSLTQPAINEYFVMSRGARTPYLSADWHPSMDTLGTSNDGDSYFWDT
ncbi:protein kinase domain-containing protein [Planctomycetaceae bacterium SH139]